MKSPSVLVTGGAGYVGSHVCKALAAEKILPVVIDNLSVGHYDAVRWGPLIESDIANEKVIARACAEYRPLATIHCAASAYVGESTVDPEKYYSNNVAGMIAMLRGCRKAGVRIIVYSSSCAIYGAPDKLPILETAPKNPVSPYGRTKRIGEEMLEDYSNAYGLRYAALRYFNACGADPESELRERHDPETHLIPRALLAASGRIQQLEIFGGDYPTADGTCVRDYIHVSDLARAHVLALMRLLRGSASFSVNLGGGRGASILEVIAVVARVTGKNVPYVVKPRRDGDPPEIYSDVSSAGSVLGFYPEHSDLETIVRTAAPTFELSVDREIYARADDRKIAS